MFEALIVTLREGMEAALVLAIAFAFLKRRGEDRLLPALWAGTALALVLSVAAAWAMQKVTVNQELTEGVTLLIGAVLVGSLAFWMWRAGPHMKRQVESGMTRAAERAGAGRVVAVFLFAFGMVFREGLETALFLSAIALNSQGLQSVLGAGIGLVLAVALAVLVVRGSLKVNLKPFFTVTTAVLVLLAIQLLIGGLHELSEAQVIPSSKAEMAIVGPVIKNDLLIFAFTLALVVAWLVLQRASVPRADAAEGPEARLRRAALERESRRRAWTGALGLATLALFVTAFAQEARVPPRPPAEPLAVDRGAVSFEAAALHDGKAHFFSVEAGGTTLRFFALETSGEVRTCFDACRICGDKGYFEDGTNLVCRNCTSPIARTSLGRKGGCNPIPLNSHVEGGRVVVATADLAAGIPGLKGNH